jgi:hypothetical protein
MFPFIILGYLIVLASWAWMIVVAFRESPLFGLLFTLVPFFSVYYIITRWQRVREPALVHLIGWLIFFIAI